jgi:hypothetical protein
VFRFPNPGSDINSFIRIYRELFKELNQKKFFTLDDISRVLVEKNLATSSGYMGRKALYRSTRDDRSRDPLYNQSKMYTELYKYLGWIHPYSNVKLNFVFTYLGAHLAESKRDEKPLVIECLLGIVQPNRILDIRNSQRLRPFAAILRTMAALNGCLSRDEMIIGPLSLSDDRSQPQFNEMVNRIASLRGDIMLLRQEKHRLALRRSISSVTMGNYTRFPLAILRWCDWAKIVKSNKLYSGVTVQFFQLTELGYQMFKQINAAKDIRGDDLDLLPKEAQEHILKYAFYQMLYRAGFDVSSEYELYNSGIDELSKGLIIENQAIIASPFQEIEPEYLNQIFPTVSGRDISSAILNSSGGPSILEDTTALYKVHFHTRQLLNADVKDKGIFNLFKLGIDAGLNVRQAVQDI